MNKLELDKFIIQKQKEREKSMNEFNSMANNIFENIKIIMQRPHWEKLYREKLFGIFIDWSDKMNENNEIFIKELEEVGLRGRKS